MKNSNDIHVVVDARSLDGRINGIARVVNNFLLNLPPDSKCKITAISNKKIVSNFGAESQVQIFEDKFYCKLPGTIWLMLRVPVLLKQIGATHFIGMEHILPFLRVREIKYAVLMHDLVHIFFPETMQLANRLISHLLFDRSYRNADVVVAVSRSTMLDLKRYLGDREISVVYLGTSFSNEAHIKKPKEQTEVLQLLYVGSIEPRKNLNALLLAFAELNRHNHDVDLTICSGNSWSAAAIQRRITGYQGFGKITVLKSISDVELRALYSSFDALILPSLYEGFGLPLIEACGKIAVVANNIAVFQELSEYIENIKFIDFSQEPHVVAKNLKNALTVCQVVRFRSNAADIDSFKWQEFSLRLLNAVID